MPHPTTRVLAVLELLQAHGRISGPDMARRLGVDGRTLRRYVAILEEFGIPITAERGRYGGYALVPGFRLPPMMFTDDEALALSVGLLAARSLGLSEAQPAVASARAKLERVMPARLKQRVRAIDETVTLDLSRTAPTGDNGVLAALSAAAQAQQRVQMVYRSARDEESVRPFDPYGLGFRGGHWYAAGFCHLRGELRSFRLDRVLAVRPLPVSFGRPAGFDALAHLSASLANMPRAQAVEVLLHTDLDTARRAFFYDLGTLEPVASGVLLRARTDHLDWFARELARLPFDFSIHGPEALRGEVRTLAERILVRVPT